MTEEKHEGCEMCELVQKLGHDSCSVLANDMITKLLDLTGEMSDNFHNLAFQAFKEDKVTLEEYEKLKKHANYAMVYAATTIAASMSFDGPKIPPNIIIDMVTKRLSEIMMNLVTSKVGNAGGIIPIPIPPGAAEGLLDTLKSLGIQVEVIGGPPDESVSSIPTAKKDKETDPNLN